MFNCLGNEKVKIAATLFARGQNRFEMPKGYHLDFHSSLVSFPHFYGSPDQKESENLVKWSHLGTFRRSAAPRLWCCRGSMLGKPPVWSQSRSQQNWQKERRRYAGSWCTYTSWPPEKNKTKRLIKTQLIFFSLKLKFSFGLKDFWVFGPPGFLENVQESKNMLLKLWIFRSLWPRHKSKSSLLIISTEKWVTMTVRWL